MAIKYIPYYPEPVEGQAILDNFKRTLRYKGANEVADKLRRGMPLYEMEKVETVGENKDGNMLIRGECISACAYLKEQGIEVDLVYIDPPFASGADYAKNVYIRRNPKVAEAIEKAEQELNIDELKAFEEKMYGDVWDKEKYLNWMYENLMAIKSVMSEIASIYVHLDYHIGHYVKILMDEIFGEERLLNEIIWCYNGPGSPGMKQFNRKHDTIFWYSKSESFIFNDNEIRIAHNEKTKENFKRGLEGSGFIADTYDLNDVGKIPEDWWEFAISSRYPVDGVRRAEYATEKPYPLIERIVKASSNKDMLIADFFGGSGVLATVASNLTRRFIHCDVGINSLQTARDRLFNAKAAFDILEIKDGVSLYRNPVQTMDKMKSLINGLKNEDSLDKFWEGAINDSKLGLVPVFVPNLMDSNTKILDEVLMNRILHEAIPDLDSNVKKVIVYYIDVVDVETIKKFIAEDESTTIEIELRDLKEILDDVVVEDYAEFSVEQVHEALVKEYKVSINKFLSDRVMQKIDAFNQKAFANSGDAKPYKPITISNEGLETIEYVSLDCTAADGVWQSDSEIKIDKLGYVIRNGQKTKNFWDGAIKCENKPLRLKIRNICGDETVWVL